MEIFALSTLKILHLSKPISTPYVKVVLLQFPTDIYTVVYRKNKTKQNCCSESTPRPFWIPLGSKRVSKTDGLSHLTSDHFHGTVPELN